jgi:hypothetical protein
MTVRFYADHNIQAAVVAALSARGVDCVTAAEDGRPHADDETLLARATQLQRTLVTHDRDFFSIFESWWSAGKEFAGIIHAFPTQITIAQLVDDLTLIAQVCEPEELRNSIVRLPL